MPTGKLKHLARGSATDVRDTSLIPNHSNAQCRREVQRRLTAMQYVPVLDQNQRLLMPTNLNRAIRWKNSGKATLFYKKGVLCARLNVEPSAHCVDSWVLANWYTEGHDNPDNTRLFVIVPLRFHRRQLHRFQPSKGNIRSPYGGTMSEGFKRGGIAKHPKYGVVYIGGASKSRVSLHSLSTGKRLTQNAKPSDIKFLSFNSWRTVNAAS